MQTSRMILCLCMYFICRIPEETPNGSRSQRLWTAKCSSALGFGSFFQVYGSVRNRMLYLQPLKPEHLDKRQEAYYILVPCCSFLASTVEDPSCRILFVRTWALAYRTPHIIIETSNILSQTRSTVHTGIQKAPYLEIQGTQDFSLILLINR